jgi:hypothetical protein
LYTFYSTERHSPSRLHQAHRWVSAAQFLRDADPCAGFSGFDDVQSSSILRLIEDDPHPTITREVAKRAIIAIEERHDLYLIVP